MNAAGKHSTDACFCVPSVANQSALPLEHINMVVQQFLNEWCPRVPFIVSINPQRASWSVCSVLLADKCDTNDVCFPNASCVYNEIDFPSNLWCSLSNKPIPLGISASGHHYWGCHVIMLCHNSRTKDIRCLLSFHGNWMILDWLAHNAVEVQDHVSLPANVESHARESLTNQERSYPTDDAYKSRQNKQLQHSQVKLIQKLN